MAAVTRNMKSREKTVFVAQQLHFANTLAGNDPKQRARAMKKLRKFFIARAHGNFCFTHDDFMRLWKGLFYCMWMSDKPLIQEELAEQISQLIHCFEDLDTTLKFIHAFFDTLIIEWYGIDYHRLDKFQMFVRRFLRQSLVFCKNYNWEKMSVRGLCNIFESTVLSPSKCEDQLADKGLNMYFVDVFIEELSKVSAGELPKDILLEFLKPFAANLVEQLDFRVRGTIRQSIFFNLIRQSPEGMEYEEKFEAWKRAGFPGTSWKDMVFVGKNDNRSGVKIKHLDPRAGKVNVYLSRLEFDSRSVAEMVKKYSEKSSSAQRRNYILKISKKFQMLANGEYPLAMNMSKLVRESREHKFTKDLIDNAVEDLISFNKKMKEEDQLLKKQCKRKKKTNGSEKLKKMKLEKKFFKENYGNERSKVSSDESSSSEYESGNESYSSEIEINVENSSSNIGNDVINVKKTSKKKSNLNKKAQPNNVHSLTKNQKEDSISSSVSEIPNLGEENGNVEKSVKEIEFESERDEANLETESTILSECTQEKVEQAQNTESMEMVQNEIIELKERKENSSQVSDALHSSQENGILETNDELENLPPELVKQSPENGNIDVVKDKEEKENILIEVEMPLGEETVLRRSVRRRSNVIPETSTGVGEKKEASKLPVNSSTPKNVKRTPQNVKKISVQCVKKTPVLRGKSKKRISKAFSAIEVEWEVNEEEEEQSQPSVQRESPVAKDKSTPLIESPAGKVNEQQLEKQDSANVSTSAFYSYKKELAVSDNDAENEESKLTPKRINLRTLKKLSLSKKRASLNSTPSSCKKVNIDLQMNCSQDFEEYIETVSSSPMVPHDVNKKPIKGVLKRSSIKSPLNPFYRPPKGIWSILPLNFK